MWIVRLALNRPYTFIVLALLILLASPVVIQRTPTDIFPKIKIPVVSVIWTYGGLSPEYTHEFPEWKKHHDPEASIPIPWQEMLEAQGKAELVEIVERNEAARQYLDSLFGT